MVQNFKILQNPAFRRIFHFSAVLRHYFGIFLDILWIFHTFLGL